jgi:hypothetical protein
MSQVNWMPFIKKFLQKEESFSFCYLWVVYDLCYNMSIMSQRKSVLLVEFFDIFPSGLK